MAPAYIHHRHPRLLLLQYRDDLLFAETAELNSVRLHRGGLWDTGQRASDMPSLAQRRKDMGVASDLRPRREKRNRLRGKRRRNRAAILGIGKADIAVL